MSTKLLMGIDAGTSGCKISVFDTDGHIVSSTTETYPTYYPGPGCVEQDANDWWSAVCTGIRKLLDIGQINPKDIAGIGVDGTSWACLPVDREGKPLRRVMMWLDRRSEKQAEWMKENIGEGKLMELSGNPVDPAYIVPKMLWLRENEPEIYNKAYKFLQSNGYLVFKLTGEYSEDYSQGYGFHFFDMSKGKWDEAMAESLGISLDLMAPIVHCDKVVGVVTGQAAKETGLAEGTPVVAGGLDAACCTLGAGVIKAGQTQEQGGQAGGMSILVDRPIAHHRLILGYHVIPDMWLLQGGTVGGGGTLKWFNEQLGAFEQWKSREDGISSFEVMSMEAEKVDAGSGGLVFLPYMAGERSPIWDSRARGVFFGLSYEKTRAHLIRSIMEGVGFSLLHNLETAAEAGAYVDELISVGGSSNSMVWTQIKADICGKKISVPFSDNATTLGAAILAGVGTGVYKDYEEAVSTTVHIERAHMPDKDKNMLYGRYYKLYLKLYDKLKDCYDMLYNISNI